MASVSPRANAPAVFYPSNKFFEPLESRVLLHAAIYHIIPADLQKYIGESGHVKASDFVKARPEYAGKNIWSPVTFNPNNSPNSTDWAYDPHWIEDDFPQAPLLDAPVKVTGGPEVATLPDLIPLTSGTSMNSGGSPVAYNYLSPFIDTTEIPGRNLMRFTTGIGNMGTGPAILTSSNTGTPPAGSGITTWINPDGTQNVLQRLYDYNAGTNQFTFAGYRPAGRMVWHSGHSHFHLEGYAQYRLLTNVGGSPGPVALRGDGTEAVGDKVGFCLVNIGYDFTLPGGAGQSSTLPGYSFQGDQGSASNNGQPLTTCGFTQGIHVGHADVYSSIYDGQWIDVTGVPDGSYFLEVTLDALNVIQEVNEANNTVMVPVNLDTDPPVGGIQPDRFEPNNSFATATNLGVLGNETQSGLTIHTTNEDDYFRFVAASSGSYQVRLNIGDRDVNLFLYDNNQVLLTSASNPLLGPTTETVTWNFVAGQTYYARAEGFGSALNPVTSGVSSNYALQVLVNPTLNASTSDGVAGEFGGNDGRISILRNGPTSSPLTVNFTVGGDAVRGVDYDIFQGGFLIAGNSVAIGNEASSAELDIVAISDGNIEALETMTLTLDSGAYVIGGGTGGSVVIHDTPPQVQTAVQTWQTSPHKLAFTFTLDVGASFGAGDVSIMNLDTNTPVNPASIVYGAGNLATVTFAGVLPDGHYRATLSGSGITHALGEPMGADYLYNFFVMTADANHDAFVNAADFSILATNFGFSNRNASTGDFNYDGVVNAADFSLLATRFGTALSATASAAGARVKVGAVPPGTTALRGLFADGDAIDAGSRRLLEQLL